MQGSHVMIQTLILGTDVIRRVKSRLAFRVLMKETFASLAETVNLNWLRMKFVMTVIDMMEMGATKLVLAH